MWPSASIDRIRGHWRWTLSLVVLGLLLLSPPSRAQSTGQPYAALLPASSLSFPNETDSNSPAVWELIDGSWTFSVFNSVAGAPRLSRGPSLELLASLGRAHFSGPAPEGGVWFESVIRDADSWYGFYHNERTIEGCAAPAKVLPRIGMARSDDRGATWVDLGPILEVSSGLLQCTTRNYYFVGGVGDLSVMLDPDRLFAYIYYSQYVETDGRVGVVAARLAWADRDAPAGRADVWSDDAWVPPSERDLRAARGRQMEPGDEDDPVETVWDYSLATPFFASTNRWDDAKPGVDVLWGPSLHWNTEIQSYVMLLNRAAGDKFEPGGVYVSFNDRLDAPGSWTVPQLLLRGGNWYPQVIGLDPTVGTDALASGVARFFMAGKSEHLIVFGRR
jgi:hypothetical protein